MKNLLIFVLLSFSALGAIPANYPDIAAATFAPKTNPVFVGTVTVTTNGLVYGDGTIQTTAANQLVKTVVAARYATSGSQFTGDNGTNSIYGLASAENLTLPVHCWGVMPYYIGYFIQSGGTAPYPGYTAGYENPTYNALELANTIFDSTGRAYPSTFNGNRIARLNPYGYIKADDNLVEFNAGDTIRSQCWVNRLTSTTNTYVNGEAGLIPSVQSYLFWFNTQPADQSSSYKALSGYTSINAIQTNIDSYTGIPTPATINAGFIFPPFLYTGYVRQADLNSIVAIGDSITQGSGDIGDYVDKSSGAGYLYRAVRTSNPLANLSIGSDALRYWIPTNGLNRTTYRQRFLSEFKYKYAWIEIGVNDLNAGLRSFSQVTNDLSAMIARVYQLTGGAKIIVSTINAQCSSVSGAYFGPGDLSVTVPNANTNTPVINDLLRNNPSAISPYIWKVWDFAALWSGATNSVKATYLANPLYTGTVTTQNTTTQQGVLWRTLIDTNANWATNQWAGQPVQITNTVAPAWPANALVASNSPNTLYILYASSSFNATNALSVGATYGIGNGAITLDGIHPAPWMHKTMATNIQAQNFFNAP
jgi:hypothetical protein